MKKRFLLLLFCLALLSLTGCGDSAAHTDSKTPPAASGIQAVTPSTDIKAALDAVIQTEATDAPLLPPAENPKDTPAEKPAPEQPAPPIEEKPVPDQPAQPAPSVTVPPEETPTENSVWIPVNGGKKYHIRSGCSNMIDPIQVSVETAIARGFTPCKRCY